MGQFTSFPIQTNTFAAYTSFVNVKDFGALGDSVTDDTTAINAAYASLKGSSGTVIWPPGTYKITDTIRIGDTTSGASAPQSEIQTLGTGGPAFGVQVNYSGPTDRPAFLIGRNPYCRFEGLYIHNAAGSTGTTTGLMIGGSGTGAFGTQTYSCLFHNVLIDNFHVGIQDGNFGAFSECTFLSCSVQNCDTGYTQNDFNTLDNMLINFGCGGCTVGITNGASENLAVYGGSSSFNGQDFQVQQNATVFIIENWRSEGSGNNVVGTGSGGNVFIRNCLFKDVNSGIAVGASVLGPFNTLHIQDSVLQGTVVLNGAPHNVTMINVGCPIDSNTNLPLFVPTPAASAGPCHLTLRNNRDIVNFPQLPTYDFDGQVKSSLLNQGSPFFTAQSLMPSILRVPWETVAANTGTPYGLDAIILSNVRQLAEGSVPGSFGVPTLLTKTTNASTASGQTLHFAATTGIEVGMQAVDTTVNNIPNGTFVQAIFSTSILLSQAVTGAIGNGDTIKFQTSPTITQGNNLRVQGQFASSATLAFTFSRSVTVTGNNSQTIVATAGRFFPADVGKQIAINGTAMSPSWTNWYGVGIKFTDSTHMDVQSAGQFNPGVGSFSATIGVNEPDGAYMVLVTGDSNETFWVTNITSAGFTVHSSNAASTAVVTCLIVR